MNQNYYDRVSSCNKCAGLNEVTTTASDDAGPLEASTVCQSCGFKDSWAYGFFESGQHMKGKCEKY